MISPIEYRAKDIGVRLDACRCVGHLEHSPRTRLPDIRRRLERRIGRPQPSVVATPRISTLTTRSSAHPHFTPAGSGPSPAPSGTAASRALLPAPGLPHRPYVRCSPLPMPSWMPCAADPGAGRGASSTTASSGSSVVSRYLATAARACSLAVFDLGTPNRAGRCQGVLN